MSRGCRADLVEAHDSLHRLGEHLPVGVQIGSEARRVDGHLAEALEQRAVGDERVGEGDAEVAEHGRVGQISLPTRAW